MLNKLFSLTGRTALVTGGSKGIGKAMARAFAEAGANIAISARHEDELKKAKAEIADGTNVKVEYFVADMTQRDQVKKLAKDVLAKLGRVDVLVTTKNGQFVPGLKKDNFRILEDGVPQTVSNFNVSQAPITAVLLTEFASTNYVFLVQALQASYAFVNTLKKDDWIAVAYYDMQPHILVDFTQDKHAAYGALNTLRIPGFAETNLFDALYDTLDRLDRVEGKKY